MPAQGSQRYRIPIAPAPVKTSPTWWARRPIVIAACWIDAAALLGVWGATRMAPAEFWPAHLLFYGPRWLLALPTLALIPLAARLRLRRAAPALAVAALAFVGASGYQLPRWGWGDGEPSLWTLRLLTCNVQGRDLRPRALADLIQLTRPDLVLLQESALGDPLDVIGRPGWHCRTEGEFCLASRYPIEEFEALRVPGERRRVVAVRAKILWCGRKIPVVAVHLMTPREGLEAILRSPVGGIGASRRVLAVQQLESGTLRRWVDGPAGEILMAGDFNLTAEHPLYRRDWHGYENAFARAGRGLGHTMFTAHSGLRIDHALCGRAWRPTRCAIGPEVGSAHRPLITDVEWAGPPPRPLEQESPS